MSYLVDLSVLLELREGAPGERLRAWFEAVPDPELYVSALTVGELRRVAQSSVGDDPAGAAELDRWLRELLGSHPERVLPFDHLVADVWGRMSVGSGLDPRLAVLAATAQVHHLTVVSREIGALRSRGIACLDPASGPSRRL